MGIGENFSVIYYQSEKMKRTDSFDSLGTPTEILDSVVRTFGDAVRAGTFHSTKGVNFIANAIGTFSYVMDSGKGRDKLLALFQYTASLYKNCMDYSLKKQGIK